MKWNDVGMTLIDCVGLLWRLLFSCWEMQMSNLLCWRKIILFVLFVNRVKIKLKRLLRDTPARVACQPHSGGGGGHSLCEFTIFDLRPQNYKLSCKVDNIAYFKWRYGFKMNYVYTLRAKLVLAYGFAYMPKTCFGPEFVNISH